MINIYFLLSVYEKVSYRMKYNLFSKLVWDGFTVEIISETTGSFLVGLKMMSQFYQEQVKFSEGCFILYMLS